MNRVYNATIRPKSCDPGRCPLCGQPNGCRLCTPGRYQGPCWCETAIMPAGLLARVPEPLRNRACICQSCVETCHQQTRNSL